MSSMKKMFLSVLALALFGVAMAGCHAAVSGDVDKPAGSITAVPAAR